MSPTHEPDPIADLMQDTSLGVSAAGGVGMIVLLQQGAVLGSLAIQGRRAPLAVQWRIRLQQQNIHKTKNIKPFFFNSFFASNEIEHAECGRDEKDDEHKEVARLRRALQPARPTSSACEDSLHQTVKQFNEDTKRVSH
jgi:hypothetical protein